MARPTQTQIARAARRWGLDNLEFVSSGANAAYRGVLGAETAYLRMVHLDDRDEGFLAAGIDWAWHCLKHGARVCTALGSRNDFLIEDVNSWMCVVWRGIEGEPLSKNLTVAQLEAWGEALARLHLASRSYTPQLTRCSQKEFLPERFTLRQFWLNISPILEPDPELWAVYLELSAWLEALPQAGMHLCHGDFRPANAVWDGKQVWVIDFDEPTLAHPEYDIARACLRDDLQPFEVGHLETFLRGYERVLPCTPERIFGFVRLRALLMLAWERQDGGSSFQTIGRELALHGARVAQW
jgi:Ser/Thr protein kinase RdoA (MazF antagonist)